MIKVGDKVKRNNEFAYYAEDVHPADMDFEKEYTVVAIYNRSMSDGMYAKVEFQTAELEGLGGEINIGLLKKIS